MQRIVSVSMSNPEAFAELLPGTGWRNPNASPIWLGYEVNEMAVGVACAACYTDYIELDWIAVEDSYQRLGIGRELLLEIQRIAREKGVNMLAASLCAGEPQMEQGERLLLQNGFMEMERMPRLSFPLQAIMDGPLRPTKRPVPKGVFFLRDISNVQFRDYNRKQGQGGSWLPSIEPEKLLPESCFVLKEGKIEGCLCFAETQDGLDIPWFQGHGSKMVAILLLAGYSAVAKRYSGQTRTHLVAVEKRIEDLVLQLAGESAVHDGDIVWMMKYLGDGAY